MRSISDPLRLEMRGITKFFGPHAALDRADLTVRAGSIHAVVGANGAGKSTLIKVLSGFHRPDAGEILIDGAPIELAAPIDALRAGVVTIYQESNLCMDLSVLENVMLGRLEHRFGILERTSSRATVQGLVARCGLDCDLDEIVRDLSCGKRQLVQIARALAHDVKVMVLDEPTAALAHSESETLFAMIRSLRDEGTSIFYVSHRMPEIFDLCDEVTVLRDGRSVLTAPVTEVAENDLVAAMVERIPHRRQSAPDSAAMAMPVLDIRHLSGPGFTDVSLVARAGKILGSVWPRRLGTI